MSVLQQSTSTFEAGLENLLQNIKLFQPKYWNVMQEQNEVNKT